MAHGSVKTFIALGCAVGAACSAGQLRELGKHERSTPALAMPFASVPGTPPAIEPRPAEPHAEPASELRVAEGAPAPAEPGPNEPAPAEPLVEAVTEAEPQAAATPEYHEPTLISVARETLIYARPSFKSQKLGYLRVGAVVSRSPRAMGNEGCKHGWYRIQPEGFVCTESSAILDTEGPSPFSELAVVRPDRMAALPYAYGRSRYPTPPFYAKLPSKLEQERAEQDMVGHLRARTAEAWKTLPNNATPAPLSAGRSVPLPYGFSREPGVVTGRAMPDSGFALLGVYEHEGRRFALNTDFQILPLDRLKPVEISKFHGIRLDEQVSLPVAFVRSQNANLYAGDPKTTGLSIARKLDYREAVPLTGREIIVSGLREFLGPLNVSVPVSRLAKWKTAFQLISLGALILGGAVPTQEWVHLVGIVSLWLAAALTFVTGYDYLRTGLKHMD